MTALRVTILLALAVCLASVAGASAQQTNTIVNTDGLRSWTVSDSISLRYFVGDWGPSGTEPTTQWSPTGRYFTVAMKRGDLATDTNVYTISMYDTEAVRAWLRQGVSGPAPTPRSLVITEASSKPAGASIQWSADERSFFYRAFDEHGVRNVFSFDVDRGTARQLTHQNDDIVTFWAAGDAIVFQTVQPELATRAYPMQPAIRLGSSTLGGGIDSDLERHDTVRNFAQVGSRVRELPFTPASGMGEWVYLSPNGRFSVVRTGDGFVLFDTRSFQVTHIADRWRGDCYLGSFRAVGSDRAESVFCGVSWAPDGSHVVLNDVTLPGEGWSAATPATIYFNVRSRSAQVLQQNAPGRSRVTLEWLSGGALRIANVPSADSVGTDATPQDAIYTFDHGGATRQQSETAPEIDTPRLQLEVRQGANVPPRLFVSDGERKAMLIDIDPLLNAIWRAEQRPFHWTEPDGRIVIGGLYLPRSFQPGRPVPLVVQPYHYEPDRFQPDGNNTSIDATQLLVARGFAVLKYDILLRDDLGRGVLEGPAASVRFDAAVRALVDARIADPDRVGLTGFSRAGYQSLYVLTHPTQTRLVAVISSDSLTGTYFSMLQHGFAGASSRAEVERLYGGPFQSSTNVWLAHAPNFNVHRAQAPFMYMFHAGEEPASEEAVAQELVGAFAVARRPLEYLYFPEGAHQLVRPRERAASLNAVVDWMAFWILNEEDPDPAKADQYRRWRQMRDEWRMQQAWEAAGNPVGSTPAANFRAN